MRLDSNYCPDCQQKVNFLQVVVSLLILTSWFGLFGPAVETKLMMECCCVSAAGRWSLGPQQTVNSLQLKLRQDEAVNLLLAAGTRHHDPTHQHRVALLLLFCLETEKGSILDLLRDGGVWRVPKMNPDGSSSLLPPQLGPLWRLTVKQHRWSTLAVHFQEMMEVYRCIRLPEIRKGFWRSKCES